MGDFRRLLAARFLFTFAVQMQAVILGWRIYQLLKDPLALGLIGLTEAGPALALALYAGYLVDRSRPLVVYKRIIFVSLLSGLLVLTEHLAEHHLVLALQVGLLYGASFLTGTARAFSQPAVFAAVPQMVSRSELIIATARMSSAMQIARIAGPAFGGFAFGFLGPAPSSSIVCVLLVGAIFAIGRIQQEILPPARPRERGLATELLSGVRYVFRHRILFPALTLDMVSVLFGGVTALLPIFAEEILLTGPKGLGALRAAPAVGATITSLILAKHSLPGRAGPWLLSAVAGFGVCILVFGASHWYAVSLLALGFSGAFDSVSMLIRSAAVQLSSPDHMRGQISAVNSIFIGSSNEIGEFESGVAARFLGTVPSVYFGGAICLLTVFLTACLSPSLRKMDLKELSPESPPP